MKILMCNILFFFITSLQAIGQNQEMGLEVIYVKAFKSFKDKSKESPKIIKGLRYKLLCNNNESIFEYLSTLKNDANNNIRFIGKGGGKGTYYKNKSKNLKLHKTNSPFSGDEYIIQIPQNEYNWIITEEKKNIKGYECIKAIAEYEFEIPDANGNMKKVKNKITAWFAPGLNYSFGPAGFDGLPGLVLEKYSNSIYFIVDEISFTKNVKILKPSKGIRVSKEDYLKLLKKKLKSKF